MRRKHTEEGGAAAVEFALLLPIFAAILMGIIQYGYYFWTTESANTAAREAARRVVVGDCWNTGNMTNYAESFASQATGVTRSADPASLDVGQNITITVTADGDILSFLPMPNGGNITRAYVARMEVDTQSSAAAVGCAGY
jgi:Flp pilus assembly protein TadG